MKSFLVSILLIQSTFAQADIVLHDDTRTEIRLAGPAKRIISLAPNITEMVYAAGAGEHLVGAVDFSDYPVAAHKLPRVGSYARVDIEAIVALKPDLVLAWESGTPPASVAQLRKLKIPVFVVEPKRIADVARDIERYGQLAGTDAIAKTSAADFRERHERLKNRYAGKPPVRMFYQVWDEPLMTVNGKQVISDVIRLCGGKNVYAELPAIAPTVSVESVLAENPDVIVAGGMGASSAAWLDQWRRWPRLNATAKNQLFFIDPNLLQRHTPRLLDGAEQLCARLEQARNKP